LKKEIEMSEEDVKKLVEDKIGKVYGFDPLTILTIVSIIIAVIRLINECKSAKSVLQASARRKGLAYRIFVKKNLLDPMINQGISRQNAEEIVEVLRQEFLSQE